MLHPPGGGHGPGRPGQLHGDVKLYVDVQVEVDQVCPGELPAVQPDVAPVPNHVPQDVPHTRGEEGLGRLLGERQEGITESTPTKGGVLYGQYICKDERIF